MKRTLFATAMFVILSQNIAFCQTDSAVLKNAVSKLRTLLVDRITERAYLHFDRPYSYYVAGDVVYFKAYVTMGERHELSKISGILHVDLIGKNNAPIKSIILQLNNGIGWGDFALPDTLKKGSYLVRAYTEWMRNDNKPYFFDQYISVSTVNSVDRSVTAAKQHIQPNLQFFPEGGDMVVDIRSKVAFKAIGVDGLGVDVKGIVVDNENKEVAKIISGHLGMGAFSLIPEEDKKYKAKVTYADGSQSTVDLPIARSSGIVLAVNSGDPTKLSIEIRANRAYYKENKNKELNMVIYWAGAVRTVKTKLDNQILGVNLPASDFRTGIIQITLFGQTGEPLSERLAFIQNPDMLNLGLTTNKPSFAKRENVQLNLNAKNKDGNAVNGSFSVSVVDESKILVDENNENSILSYLLLTTDLKGYVEKPNYYFTDESKETRANLDVLMLTQGYRRFAWKQLLNENSTAISYKPEVNIAITGTLATKAGAPIPNGKVTLLDQTNGYSFTQTTDVQGRFNFPNMAFFEGTTFVATTKSLSGKNAAVIMLDHPLSGPVVNTSNEIDTKYNANADILASLQNNHRPGIVTADNTTSSILIRNDKSVDPKITDNYRSSNIGGAGHADQVINGENIKNAPTLSSGLNGIARGIDFVQGVPYLKGNTVMSMGVVVAEPMLVLIDGNATGGSMDVVNPNLVETVEVLKGANAAIYGNRGGPGVLVITTRQGQSFNREINKETAPGIFSITPGGFYKAREFYSPRYDTALSGNNVLDNRTTIFWKPDVNTDAEGNASFNFFNANAAGTYRVEVQGIDRNGNLGRQVFRYKVE
jgi:hypothetical protein